MSGSAFASSSSSTISSHFSRTAKWRAVVPDWVYSRVCVHMCMHACMHGMWRGGSEWTNKLVLCPPLALMVQALDTHEHWQNHPAGMHKQLLIPHSTAENLWGVKIFTVSLNVHRFCHLFGYWNYILQSFALWNYLLVYILYKIVLPQSAVVCHTISRHPTLNSLYLTCAVVLILDPALSNTLTTPGWPLWDAAIRAVAPSCEERWRELPTWCKAKHYECPSTVPYPAS